MKKYNFNDFMNIIRQLRGENGCPWDKEQTHESLKSCVVEECYEVVEAIDNKDIPNLREELGDILLQVALHSVIGEEFNEFTIDDVIQEVSEKMIRRHPHVFGEVEVKDSEGVIRNWDEIKQLEKQEKTLSESLIKVPRALPATIRAAKVQKKALKIGIDLDNYEMVISSISDKLNELQIAKVNRDLDGIDKNFGDLMFLMVNLSRFLQLNAENSLTNATDKFINRFVGIEHIAHDEGKHLSEMSIDELNALWGRVENQNEI